MALAKYYIIQDATNGQYYTDNHSNDLPDRWSSDIGEAHRYSLISDAETELNTDTFSTTDFIIIEIAVKTS